jgi:hypothetical protein
MDVITVVNTNGGLRLLGLYGVRVRCTGRLTRTHINYASSQSKGEELLHVGAFRDGLVQVLSILGLS